MYTNLTIYFLPISFHEMGQYDFPALVDYVLKQTGHSKLHYISFSYSTTVFIAGNYYVENLTIPPKSNFISINEGLTLKPEYNAKIASGIVMGPR